MWSVGLSTCGNEVGLSAADYTSLSKEEQIRLRQAAEIKLYATGAHYVVSSLSEILSVLDAIEARLARGEKP